MRKNEAKKRKAAWSKALAEGRVVKFGDLTLTAYLTVEMAQNAVVKIGNGAEIVKV